MTAAEFMYCVVIGCLGAVSVVHWLSCIGVC